MTEKHITSVFPNRGYRRDKIFSRYVLHRSHQPHGTIILYGRAILLPAAYWQPIVNHRMAWPGAGYCAGKIICRVGCSVFEVYTKGGLGYLYGIVDMSFSLLALETDKVSEQLNAKLADSGAPYLLDTEIFKPNLVTTSIHAPNTGVNPAAGAITFVQTEGMHTGYSWATAMQF